MIFNFLQNEACPEYITNKLLERQKINQFFDQLEGHSTHLILLPKFSHINVYPDPLPNHYGREGRGGGGGGGGGVCG